MIDIENRIKIFVSVFKDISEDKPLRKKLEKVIILSRVRGLIGKNMSLNVGCGATNQYPFRNFNCYINCDVSVPEIEMNIKNYIRCEAMHLPFRPIFNYLIASNLVEHLPDPDKTIEGFQKMSRYILIIVPHALSPNAYFDPSHRWVRFNGKWHMTPNILKILVHSRFLNLSWEFVSFLMGLPRQKIIEIRGR